MQVQLSGPMLKAATADAAVKRIYEHALDLAGIVSEARVKKELKKGKGVVTGHLRRSIAGELKKDLTFQVDAGETRQGKNVVYAEWVERGHGDGNDPYSKGVSTWKPTAEERVNPKKFQGYGMFASARKQLEKENHDRYFQAAIKRELG